MEESASPKSAHSKSGLARRLYGVTSGRATPGPTPPELRSEVSSGASSASSSAELAVLGRMSTVTLVSAGGRAEHPELAPEPSKPGSFWRRHFGSRLAVAWSLFEDAFRVEYEPQCSALLLDTKWLLNLMHRNIFLCSDPVSLEVYSEFRSLAEKVFLPETANVFFHLVADLARVEVAIQRVASMDGRLAGEHRLRAILDLASSTSHLAVTQSLMSLTASSDVDTRVLAVVALGRICVHQRRMRAEGAAVPSRLDAMGARPVVEQCLADPDRIVRQASAAALGAMCHPASGARLLRAWRNDPASPVRE